MYQRFTDRARKIMQLANQEAQRRNHEYIGTEHILLGLVKEGSGVAARSLLNLDVLLKDVEKKVEKLVQSGPEPVTASKLPQTPRTKKVIEYAIEEARNLNHDWVGTEHLLLGLFREQEGVAAQVLADLGLKLEEVREEALEIISCSDKGPQTKATGARTMTTNPTAEKSLDYFRRLANLPADAAPTTTLDDLTAIFRKGLDHPEDSMPDDLLMQAYRKILLQNHCAIGASEVREFVRHHGQYSPRLVYVDIAFSHLQTNSAGTPIQLRIIFALICGLNDTKDFQTFVPKEEDPEHEKAWEAFQVFVQSCLPPPTKQTP